MTQMFVLIHVEYNKDQLQEEKEICKVKWQ